MPCPGDCRRRRRRGISEQTLELGSLPPRPTSQTGVSKWPADKIIPVPSMEYLTSECDDFIVKVIFDMLYSV